MRLKIFKKPEGKFIIHAEAKLAGEGVATQPIQADRESVSGAIQNMVRLVHRRRNEPEAGAPGG